MNIRPRIGIPVFGLLLALRGCNSGAQIPADLVMKFEQRECYGPCPVYAIEVQGDGSATYIGHRYVAVKGEHHFRLSGVEVADLLRAFDAVGFDRLEDGYAAPATDLPSEVYTLSRNSRKKAVDDGRRFPALRPVYEAFDRYGHGARWARGDRDTVASLRRENFDFRSREAGALFTRAAILGDSDVVRNLIEEDVPLNVETEFLLRYVCQQRNEVTAQLLRKVKARAGSCYP